MLGNYVPILKGKPGEYQALRTLSARCRSSLTPLIEVLDQPERRPRKIPPKKPRPPTTFDQYLEKQIQSLIKAIRTTVPFFVDTHLIPVGRKTITGAHPLLKVVCEMRAIGLRPIPVITPDVDPAYRAAVRTAVSEGGGICIRIQSDYLFDGDFSKTAGELLAQVGLKREDADLILDLGYVHPESLKPLAAAVPGLLRQDSKIKEWRSLTLAGGSFPENLMGLTPGQIHSKPRADWLLWKRLLAKRETLPLLPKFGDYAIQHPTILPMNFIGSASIRYTVADDWVIFRGKRVTDADSGGFEQYRRLAKAAIRHPDYSGEDFSWGDEFIATCAKGQGRTGNLSIWRAVGTSHHLTYVVHQVASALDAA